MPIASGLMPVGSVSCATSDSRSNPADATVRLVDNDPTEGCKVGRTGRVTFGQ
jgi:hypothetical protein